MFHVNDEGDVKPCKATTKACRFGIHSELASEAETVYAVRMMELEGKVELGTLNLEYMNKHFPREAGRWCDTCNQHGSHYTDRHEEFAKIVAFNESVGCCGVADCYERISCPTIGGSGHMHCGVCEKHGIPRHRCGDEDCMAWGDVESPKARRARLDALSDEEYLAEMTKERKSNEQAWDELKRLLSEDED